MWVLMEKAKIVFLVRNLYKFSGAANQALKLAEVIHESIEDIIIINIEDEDKDESLYKGIKVKTIYRKNIFKVFIELAKLKFSSNNLVIHSQGFYLDVLTACYILRVPYIIKSTLNGSDDFCSLSKSRLGWLKIYLARRCSANNSLTKQMRKINNTYLEKDKIYTIPNVVLTSDQECSIKLKKNKVIFVGGIVKRKRPDLAIKFFNNNFSHKYTMDLYGPSSELLEFDPEYYNYCLSLADSRVKFHDKINNDDVLKIMLESKALLFFSENEGMPNVVLEAMSKNCVPFLSSMNGLAEELIPQYYSELVVLDYDKKISDIEGGIEKIISSHNLSKHVEKKYSSEIIKLKTIDMYERVINEH